MPKIPECDCCLFYSPSPYLVCGVHPEGVEGDSCIDFRPDPKKEPEEKWSPQGYSWYGDELIANRPSRYSQTEHLEILDTHPLFTGRCPECGYEFERENPPRVHYDCPSCGWVDDSI